MRRKLLAPTGLRPGEVTGEKAHTAKIRIVGVHAHGCNQCGKRYSDACADPLHNGRCQGCSGNAYGRPMWDVDADPQPCCGTSSRPATHSERERYRLGGDSSWWLCRLCSRTSPYEPTQPGTGADDECTAS